MRAFTEKTNYEIIPQAPVNFLKNKMDVFQMNSEL